MSKGFGESESMTYQGKYEITDLLADMKRKISQEFSSMLRGYLGIIPCTSSSSGRKWHPDVDAAVRYCINIGKQPSRHCPPAWALGEGYTAWCKGQARYEMLYRHTHLVGLIATTN
jgi:hypothetical protein